MDLSMLVEDLSQTLAWTLVHFLWQGILIGLVYALCKRAVTTVAARHNLALAALLLLLAAPALTFWQLSTAAADEAAVAAASTVTVASASGDPSTPDAVAVDDAEPAAWTYAIVLLWLLGTGLTSFGLLHDLRRLRRAIRESGNAPQELLTLLQRQMERLGIRRPVSLRLTASISTPGVYGLIRPIVLLPVALALCLPRDQLETLIAHELAHIRRADYISNVLSLVARTLLYFHPVVHQVCRDLECARETLCDDLVVGLDIDPLKYARALSRAEEYRQQVPVPLLTATGGVLSGRVRRILDLPAQQEVRAPSWQPLLAFFALLATLLAASAGQRIGEPSLAGLRPEFAAALQYLRLERPVPAPLPPADFAPSAPTVRVLPVALDAEAGWEPPTPPVAATDAGAAMTSTATAAAVATQITVDTPAPSIASAAPEPAVAIRPLAPDHAERTTTEAARTGLAAPVAPTAIRQVHPDYPAAARRDGIEGKVRLRYRIDADGRPADIAVMAADAGELFVDAALTALGKWRFQANAGTVGRAFQQEFVFRLDERSPTSRCEQNLGSKICRRRG